MPDVTAEVARSPVRDSVLNLVLMGTGPFAVPAFDALYAAGHNCLKVVTRPPRLGPGKRPAEKSPVWQWADQHDLPVVAPESINSAESVALLASLRPDLLVVCDYGQILRAEALAMAQMGGINLHGSLLPAYRGAAPVQWAVLNGDTEAGVSVIHMTTELDAGPVIVTRRTTIGPKETAGQLESRLALLGAEATVEAVDLLSRAGENPDSLQGAAQDAERASRAPRLIKADGRILWTRRAAELERHVFGMQPWPGAFTEVPAAEGRRGGPLRLGIVDVDVLDEPVGDADVPGQVRIQDGHIDVAAGDGWIRLVRIKPAGKREMVAEEWLRGRPVADGAILR